MFNKISQHFNAKQMYSRLKVTKLISQMFLSVFLLILVGCGESEQQAQTDHGNTIEITYTKTKPACLNCHNEIEQLHENIYIDCVDCHGGDYTATDKQNAHVQPTLPIINDVTVAPLDYDLPYQRFVNPSNLRIVKQTCGNCHEPHVEVVLKSMMSTTAGHHSGGLYNNGVDATKTPTYGSYEIDDKDGEVPTEKGAVAHLDDLLDYDPNLPQDEFSTHYRAVPGQACARCHLWSRGKGYRGAENQKGVYRADGCAACHMPYANDGLSLSADKSINHEEPGHPKFHRVTKAIPSEQCIHCHHRGARIGLSFTGRSQMPPRLPSGPEVTGTTNEKFNNNYHYADDETNPQDIHGELGLACIDCHTQAGIMGDGNIYGHMDQATKVECRTCHGLPNKTATLIDKDGLPLNNIVKKEDGTVVLTSKVSGNEHIIKQIKDLINPESAHFNEKASHAMNDHHLKEEGGLECYACHSSWMPNCFGCHFERDETKLGLNLKTREWTEGKASTNNKMFVSLKHFAMGLNAQSKVSPYIVGCHPIADVTAADGSKKLDFVMPKTKVKGISGLAFNPVNSHTTRGVGEVRKCVECHRSPPSLGLGTGNYSLARTHGYLITSQGINVYERWANPNSPVLVDTIKINEVPLALAVNPNVVSGRADQLYVAYGSKGIAIYDMASTIAKEPSVWITGVNAINVEFVAGFLYITVKDKGIDIYDVTDMSQATFVASIDIKLAIRSTVWGVHLFVAAGNDGLVVVDISNQQMPKIVGKVEQINAQKVSLYAHFQKSNAFAARAYVVDPSSGIHIIDLLPDFSTPKLVKTIDLPGATSIDTYTRYVTAVGDIPSREHDYLYITAADSLHIFDITKPDDINQVASLALSNDLTDIDVFSHPVPPGVDDYAFISSGSTGLHLVNVTDPIKPILVTNLAADGAKSVHVDVQQLDRFIDEQGNELKENSHPGARAFNRQELIRMLKAEIK